MSLESVLYDVTSAILASQNNETAAILVSKKPVLWDLNIFLLSRFNQLMYKAAGHEGEKVLYTD